MRWGCFGGQVLHRIWTAACLAADLPAATVLHATCGEAELAVWRTATGRVAAWTDRCPHRGMRLSHGFVRGEALSCIYHGWTYGADGACRRIPAHPEVVPPASIRAEVFSVIEADGIVWVAPQGTTAAPPDLAGFEPVRALTVNQSLAGIDAHLGGAFSPPGAALRKSHIQGQSVGLWLQLLGPDRLTLVGLIGTGAGVAPRVMLSRWLEDLRRRAETKVTA